MKEFAFPHWDGPSGACHNGMTIRDWFAGMAMAALVASPNCPDTNRVISGWAYEMADAMLSARKKEAQP